MIRCGKLAEPKSFALIVVRSFAMLMGDGVVPCDVVVVAGASFSFRSCRASSSLTSSMILFSSWVKRRLWLMFIESTRSLFILRAKKFLI